MAIVAGDIDFHLSGGAANSDVNASLGGVRSSVEITGAALNNLFDQVSGDESAAGDVEYRCFYILNSHGSLTLQNAAIFIQTNTPDPDSSADIGIGTAAINGTEQTVADEDTAPSGVTFSSADGSGNALAIGDIPPGEHRSIWVRWTISAAADALASDDLLIRVQGDTAA